MKPLISIIKYLSLLQAIVLVPVYKFLVVELGFNTKILPF